MPLSKDEFDLVRKVVRDRSAIVLEEGKEYLVEARLNPVAREFKLPNLSTLIQKLKGVGEYLVIQKVVEAMTTNETFFFRDIYPFDSLKKNILPDLLSRRSPSGPLNIWCAASSTGQEPYTIAMLIAENFPQLKNDGRLKIIASDINETVLNKAREGIYTQLEVNRGLPASLLVKYFQKKTLNWQLKDDLRKMVEYRNINLCQPLPQLPPLDLVFIRNVLIYFDVETKKKVLAGIKTMLKPDAYLYLGGAETTFGIDEDFERIRFDQAVCYQLKRKK
ncbi:MAG: protein-glutamate O-methyltransferase CheR [Deltaproteobacteria bacterium]|nr:protein-glutamate O-methyltransferase CheR [Deltaproteobacteria bacterium]